MLEVADGHEECRVCGNVTHSSAVDCVVKFDSLQLRMSGFGGSTAWAGGLANTFINELFSPVTGCGLTLVRMRISPNGTTGSGENCYR